MILNLHYKGYISQEMLEDLAKKLKNQLNIPDGEEVLLIENGFLERLNVNISCQFCRREVDIGDKMCECGKPLREEIGVQVDVSEVLSEEQIEKAENDSKKKMSEALRQLQAFMN